MSTEEEEEVEEIETQGGHDNEKKGVVVLSFPFNLQTRIMPQYMANSDEFKRGLCILLTQRDLLTRSPSVVGIQ